MIRFLIIFFLLFLGLFQLSGQNQKLLYDFTDIPQALIVNPGAVAPHDWFVGIPLLSKMSFSVGSSGISALDLFASDGIDINEKIREKAVFGMDPSDDLTGTAQIELISGGFRGKNQPKNYYSFGLYNEVDGIGYWFGDIAILAFEGNVGSLGKRFDLSHLNTRGEMLNVFHFGINRQVNGKLIVGGRAKIYSGIFSFQSTSNDGYFVTTEGENNLLANTLNADMRLRTSGLESLRESLSEDNANEMSILTNHLLSRGFFGGDIGFGIDVGLTHYLNEQWVVSGSLLDLGFMLNYSDVSSYELNGNATSEGVQVILPDALSDPDQEFWEDLVDEIETLIPFTENQATYLSIRPIKLYGSMRYNFGKVSRISSLCDCDYRYSSKFSSQVFDNSLGLQFFAVNRPRGPQVALTGFYQRRLGNSFSLRTTYTIDKYSLANLGLGMNLRLGPAEFYFLFDNLLAFQNLADTQIFHMTFGANLLSWTRNK